MRMNKKGRAPASARTSQSVSAASFDNTEDTIAAATWKAFQAVALNHEKRPTHASQLKKEEAYRAFCNAFLGVAA